MQKTKSTRSTRKTLTSWRALAEALGTDHGYLHKQAHRTDCEKWPCSFNAPWGPKDVVKIGEWLIRIKQRTVDSMDDGGDADSVVALRKEKLREEIAILRLANRSKTIEIARIESTLLDAEQVKREWVQIAVRMRNEFQNLGASILPDALVRGLPRGAASEFQRIVDAKVNGILRALSGGSEPSEATAPT